MYENTNEALSQVRQEPCLSWDPASLWSDMLPKSFQKENHYLAFQKGTLANSADPDNMQKYNASDLGLQFALLQKFVE